MIGDIFNFLLHNLGLITSVGTGDIVKDSDRDYKTTTYILEDKFYPNETLIAKVLAKHFEIDKIIFVGTNKSMWDSIYYTFDGDDEKYLDLLTEKKNSDGVSAELLDKLHKKIDVYIGGKGTQSILLDYEKHTDDEIWGNFASLLNIRKYVNDGDKIYLDITHGFRYMPILNIFLLEFLSIANKTPITVEGVFYGMLSQDKSKIIDFKIFFDLLEWSKAVNMFQHNADADQLVALLSKENQYNDIAKIFTQLSTNLKLANMASLWQFIKAANKKIKVIKQSDNKILDLFSEELISIVSRLDKQTQSEFQFELAKWLHENKNYALSYIALYEAIITKSCELHNYNVDDYERRDEAKKSLGDDKYGKYFYTKHTDSLSQIRNSIVHQSNDRKDKVQQDISKLEQFFETFEPYFQLHKEA